jgi:flagellar protein FlgJ
MAVALSTDIVADVMSAASPERLQAAREHLRGIASAAASRQATKPDQAAAYQKFDAMVLGTFVETMLPNEADSVYGGGLAGDMWKSMMAQQLGDSLASRGVLNIASRYIGDRYADGDVSAPLRGAVDPAARAAIDGQNGMSRSLIEELQRKALDAISGTGGGAE